MIITNKLTMDLTKHSNTPVIYAVQGDQYSRNLELTLLANGNPWMIPDNTSVVIRYSKADGIGGEYDTLPDETAAWSANENILILSLAPQVLTTPGAVSLSVTLMQDQIHISTFAIMICVESGVHSISEEYFHVPGFLPAPEDAEVGQYLSVSAVDSTGHVTRIKAVTPTSSDTISVEPAEEDIPKVFFGAALPQAKDDTIMSFRYISRTEDIKGYCKTKAQGNSSMSYPKKNQTVKLYRDAECTEKLKVNLKGWGEQDKFCFKANWVDLTHARNIVSARLWGDVVKSRANYEEIPELLRTSPNQGAVDGFPVKVYAGGIYQGRYTINIPKDAWMANMDEDLDNHCILCGENYVSGCFRAEAKIDGSDWTDEVHKTVPDAIKSRWNETIRFVMNSTDEEFITGIGNYFDVDSLIDYYLFGLIACNNDGFGKNQLYHTYDGLKWYATVYDVDNTFGTYLGSVLAYDFPRCNYEDYKHNSSNLLFVRLERLFEHSIKIRYAELKNDAMSITNIINRFERFTDITPTYLIEEDYAETTANGAFTGIPHQGVSNIQQIRDYIINRYPYVDGYIESMGKDPDLLYSLPEATTFDGTAGQGIDTGVKLFDEPKNFTILLDVATADTYDANRAIVSCAYNSSKQHSGGVQIKTNQSWASTGFYISGKPSNGGLEICGIISSTERTKIAVVFMEGLLSSAYYKKDSDSAVTTRALNANASEQASHDGSTIIGATLPGGEAFVGTVYSCEIYGKALSAAEIEAHIIAKSETQDAF